MVGILLASVLVGLPIVFGSDGPQTPPKNGAQSVPADVAPQKAEWNAREFYSDWSLDQDRNGMDDVLDAELAEGRTGTLILHVHYDRRPTEADAQGLRADKGALQTYVFRNWDDIKVETTYDRVPGFLEAAGVVAIEKWEPPVMLMDVSRKAIRASAASGVPVVDGVDHLQAVHETLGLRGEGMVIAVLDTGVDNTHESLDDMDDNPATNDPKLVQKIDPLTGLPIFAGIDASAGFKPVECVDPVDDNLHGTHVAGTALGTGGPTKRFMGVAPGARLVDIDIAINAGATAIGLGQDIAEDWLISYNKGETCYGDPGEDRVDVATMSFGSGGSSPTGTFALSINRLVRSGVTFTLAAGNSGSNANTLVGGADGAIIVAAADDRNTVVRSDDFLASFSSRGPRPSDGDTDATDELRPDIAAPGVNIFAPLMHSLNAYVGLDGTSMATPHVAGVAALMLQANPNLRPTGGSDQELGDVGRVPVRDILQQTAQYKTAVAGAAPQQAGTGKFGLPWNNAWGYGYIDAFAAARLARVFGQQPLEASAGGPYAGSVGAAIPVAGSVTGGAPPYGAFWMMTAWPAGGIGFFGSNFTLETTFTPKTPGTYELTLRVTDSAGTVATSTASLQAIEPGGGGGEDQVLYSFSFDSGAACTAQGWQSFHDIIIGNPSVPSNAWHLEAFRPHTPRCAWYHGDPNLRVYQDLQLTSVVSPAGAGCFVLPANLTSARFEFQIAGTAEKNFDFLFVQSNNGCPNSAWTTLPNGTLTGPHGDWGPDPPAYVQRSLDLSSKIGAGAFQLRFLFDSDEVVFDDGYRIDTFRVVGTTGSAAPNLPPVAVAQGPAALEVGEVGTFDGSGSFDPDGVIQQYVWHMGDGTSITGSVAQHAFSSAGNYTIRLIVTDNAGAFSEARLNLTVTAAFRPQNPQLLIQSPSRGAMLSPSMLQVSGVVDLGTTGLPVGGGTLHFIGDGSNENSLTAILDSSASHYMMTSTGQLGTRTTFTTIGAWAINAYNNIPIAKVTSQEPVFLSGEPIRLYLYVDYPNPGNAAAPGLCPLGAHLFSSDGTSLITAIARAPAPFDPGIPSEVVFTFQPKMGVYPGLRVQFAQSIFLDGCSAVPPRWVWGSEQFAARLELGAKDALLNGPLGPDQERVELYLDDAVSPFAVRPVDTRANHPVETWNTSLNLTAASLGEHAIRAVWLEADGRTVDVDQVIFRLEPPNQPPVAAIRGPSNGARAEPIRFDATGSQDSDGRIVAYAWDFGDGTRGGGPLVEHAYSALGAFTVTLFVVDDDGATATATHQIKIANALPTAVIDAPGTASRRQLILFNGSHSQDPDGKLISFHWDFGDGSTATDPTAFHEYRKVGDYIVTLRVTDNDGATATATHTIRIGK